MKELFGRKATDKITGFSGIITGACAYITGCTQYLVHPKVKEDGTGIGSRWFDEGRLAISEKVEIDPASLESSDGTGPCEAAPIR